MVSLCTRSCPFGARPAGLGCTSHVASKGFLRLRYAATSAQWPSRSFGLTPTLRRTTGLNSSRQQMRRIGHDRLLLRKESLGVNQLFAGAEFQNGFHTGLDKLRTACGKDSVR